ncbi:MAG: RNA-binding S4 domain-containing protein [Bacteroidales bacterium]|nr:RNA-binding S4 domain-containing protein [Bacteroidales bacterium]MCM1146977.1 RNA-binding S4 domain-containing protein [Bacteroidales bacterium]MCM1205890.1 RNA-binding S4 domain-containing protein [Bacillota bacterium]MCM1509869.1 RNA-binding S4 domain-containing protein [Clostridium sp.]
MEKKLKHQDTARLDKWLWAARIFKTRTVAANACKNSRVSVSGVGTDGNAAMNAALAKPSRTVKCGEVIHVKKSPIIYSFRILNCIENRVGAKLIPEVYENVTTAKQYELLEMSRISGFIDRQRGTGRPTKKERRQLDDFNDMPVFGFEDEEEDDIFDFDE